MAYVQQASQEATSARPRKRSPRKSRIENENETIFTKETNKTYKSYTLNIHLTDDDSTTRDFEFVTITRPSDANNTEVAKQVRTQAMRDYLRRQTKQAITGIEEVVASIAPEEPAQYKGRFKLDTWSHKTRTKALNARRERALGLEKTAVRSNRPANEDDGPAVKLTEVHRSPNPINFLDGHSIDPFDSLSVKLGRRSEGLLRHYHHSYSMNSVAINTDGDFFSYARTDPALLNSILYLVALHHDLKSGVSDSPECLYHGGKAFRIINQRLQDGVFSDMTIAAVAMLVTRENLNGNYEASKIHMRGLEYMIKKRGGIHTIQGVFSRIVTWSDFCYANVWNCQPRFPLLPFPPLPSEPFTQASNPLLLVPENLFGFESPMIPIFTQLRAASSAAHPPTRYTASKLIYNTEYFLLHLNKKHADDLEPMECVYAFEAIPLKLAAHLYLYLVMREIPRTSQLLQLLVERLQDALEIQLGGWWDSSIERRSWLVWILFMGGAAGQGRVERWWFVKELSKMCASLGVYDREGLESVLRRILWMEGWSEEHVRSLWNDVIMLDDSKEAR